MVTIFFFSWLICRCVARLDFNHFTLFRTFKGAIRNINLTFILHFVVDFLWYFDPNLTIPVSFALSFRHPTGRLSVGSFCTILHIYLGSRKHTNQGFLVDRIMHRVTPRTVSSTTRQSLFFSNNQASSYQTQDLIKTPGCRP